ncbi:MAG: hypothetical protein U5J63_18525 [Fodinibius sp.]|nr:hypothetical protein [Fodinibius sp.]
MAVLPGGAESPAFWGTRQSELVLERMPSFSDPLKFSTAGAKLKELTVDLPETETAVLGSDLNIYSQLSLQGGVLQTKQHALSLVGNRDGTAALAAGGGSVNGDISYRRRYHFDGSGWRLISVPFDDVPFSSLQEPFHTQGGAWAEDVIEDPGGSGPTSNLWFFDEDTQSYSGYYGDDSAFEPGNGYLFYMYADAPDGSSILPADWQVSGDRPSERSVPLAYQTEGSTEYSLVGNPFAGALDWQAVVGDNSKLGTCYAVWDPSMTESGGLEGFIYYNAADGVGGAGRYIAPMQGFL